MREAPLPTGATPVEEIVEFTWNATGILRIVVAPGHNVDGKFIPLPNAQAQQFTVMWEDYQEFFESVVADETDKGRPSGAIFVDDLWKFVDRCRAQKDAATVRETARRINQQ